MLKRLMGVTSYHISGVVLIISHTLNAPSFDAGVVWRDLLCVVLCCVVLCCVVVLALVSTQTPCHNHML